MKQNKPTFEVQLRHRINAGRVAIKNQIDFFEKQFGRVTSEWKDDASRVTFADFAISERIFKELGESFPEDDYCSEEFSSGDSVIDLESPFCWVLDPIDGTNNYFLEVPLCAISLALLHNGYPIYGMIYDLSRKQIIEGGPEHDLMDGTRRAQVSAEPMGAQSVVGFHFPMTEQQLSVLSPWLQKYRARSLGSAALTLAYTALGKLNGCIDYKVKVWDIAAAYALVLAAGGEFHFIDKPVFPLRQFHVNMDSLPYYAGSASFCAEVQKLGLEAAV